ncbi:hypothetical protein AURDEDRAFT_116560 [Auricularia subglabra TFB-10046 SS5]|nr:hypothetical protein AURDEDRAFT_116560 [Auricularia subglabra TFB-10046 SS5]
MEDGPYREEDLRCSCSRTSASTRTSGRRFTRSASRLRALVGNSPNRAAPPPPPPIAGTSRIVPASASSPAAPQPIIPHAAPLDPRASMTQLPNIFAPADAQPAAAAATAPVRGGVNSFPGPAPAAPSPTGWRRAGMMPDTAPPAPPSPQGSPNAPNAPNADDMVLG